MSEFRFPMQGGDQRDEQPQRQAGRKRARPQSGQGAQGQTQAKNKGQGQAQGRGKPVGKTASKRQGAMGKPQNKRQVGAAGRSRDGKRFAGDQAGNLLTQVIGGARSARVTYKKRGASSTAADDPNAFRMPSDTVRYAKTKVDDGPVHILGPRGKPPTPGAGAGGRKGRKRGQAAAIDDGPAISMRLNKVLAQSGQGSRRNIDILISQGHFRVNGEVAELGAVVTPNDYVTLDGRPIKLRFGEELPRVLLYHKPEGEIVTRVDPENRPTVFDRLPKPKHGRWVTVGRLDFNTEGLLILTTSGDLANRFMHPRYGEEREYAVRVLGELTEEHRHALLNGIDIEGELCKFDSLEDRGGEGANHWHHVVLKEGKNREVRKLFEACDLTVSRLIRVRFGDIALPRELGRGEWREMADEEVADLFKRLELDAPALLARPTEVDREDATGPEDNYGNSIRPAKGRKGQRGKSKRAESQPQGKHLADSILAPHLISQGALSAADEEVFDEEEDNIGNRIGPARQAGDAKRRKDRAPKIQEGKARPKRQRSAEAVPPPEGEGILQGDKPPSRKRNRNRRNKPRDGQLEMGAVVGPADPDAIVPQSAPPAFDVDGNPLAPRSNRKRKRNRNRKGKPPGAPGAGVQGDSSDLSAPRAMRDDAGAFADFGDDSSPSNVGAEASPPLDGRAGEARSGEGRGGDGRGKRRGRFRAHRGRTPRATPPTE